MSRVLVAPANFGLGHATRDIPIIHELLEEGHKVHIATNGAALALLKKDMPDCKYLEIPDYPHELQAANNMSLPKLTKELRKIRKSFQEEAGIFEELAKKKEYDLIISDGRYGAYSKNVPSLIISHQLRFRHNAFPEFFAHMTELAHKIFFKNFEKVIVPDNENESISLTGELSKTSNIGLKGKVYYAGILCSIEKNHPQQDIDLLVAVSGPEPHRKQLEDLVLREIKDVELDRKVVVLGNPRAEGEYYVDFNTQVISHAKRKAMANLMNRSKMVLSRSGYTTIMELANIDKKKALFVPTPGSIEQEYLAERYMKKGWFNSVGQEHLNLSRDLKSCEGFSGFPEMPHAKENAKKLYQEVISKYL